MRVQKDYNNIKVLKEHLIEYETLRDFRHGFYIHIIKND